MKRSTRCRRSSHGISSMIRPHSASASYSSASRPTSSLTTSPPPPSPASPVPHPGGAGGSCGTDRFHDGGEDIRVAHDGPHEHDVDPGLGTDKEEDEREHHASSPRILAHAASKASGSAA